MKISGILKDAFLFPSKNIGRFAIYLLLSVLMVGFALGGLFTYTLGVIDGENYLLGGMYLIISLLIGFFITGYHTKVIKSGIELADNLPVFELYDDFMTGFDNIVVSIAYYLIPTLMVVVVGLDTNIIGNAITLVQEFALQAFNVYIMGNSTSVSVNAISLAINNLIVSISITIAVGIVLFIIFSIISSMAQARYAHTGSLREALNILETLKDIMKIGVGKVILIILLIIAIIAIIEFIFITVLHYFPFLLSVIYIIITPYLLLTTQRVIGLLYSDIA